MKLVVQNDSLLAALDKHELSHEERDGLHDLILNQIDQAALIERALEDEMKRFRDITKEFAMAAKKAQTRLERFQEEIVTVLERCGFERLPGDRFEAVLTINPGRVEMKKEKPTEFDAEAYPGIVRVKTTYEWDKVAIKEILKDVDIPFARVIKDARVEFKIKGA